MNKLATLIKFLMFFSGLDNAFVILNSWHRSDKKASVEDRLGDTMSEAGVSSALMMIFSRGFFITILKIFQVSILITSLTDIISFYTAVLAPYPYVKIFCLYTGTALAFNFIYQVN